MKLGTEQHELLPTETLGTANRSGKALAESQTVQRLLPMPRNLGVMPMNHYTLALGVGSYVVSSANNNHVGAGRLTLYCLAF
jgi:hypothetical protein